MPKKKNTNKRKPKPEFSSGKLILIMSGAVAFVAAIEAACKGNILKLAQHYLIASGNESRSSLGITNIKNYDNYTVALKTRKEARHGESIPDSVCDVQIEAPKHYSQLTTKYGFSISIPRPDQYLENLINGMIVSSAGNPSLENISSDIKMLRAVLSAIGNHQILARCLLHPYFNVLINYEEDSQVSSAAVHPDTMTLILHKSIFKTEDTLISSLRNEFSHLETVVSNDCRFGQVNRLYEQRTNMFFVNQQTNTVNNKAPDDIVKFTLMIRAKMHELINLCIDFAEMDQGKIQKNDWYYSVAQALEEVTLTFPKFSTEDVDAFEDRYAFLPEDSDSIINVYKSREKEGVSNLYVPVKSICNESGTRRFEYLYDDPRTLVGRFRSIVRGLQRVNTKLMNHPTYQKAAMKSQHANARMGMEYLSFIQQALPNKLRQILLPEFCDHMTKLARSSRSSCGY